MVGCGAGEAIFGGPLIRLSTKGEQHTPQATHHFAAWGGIKELFLQNWAVSFARYQHLLTPQQQDEALSGLEQQVKRYKEAEQRLRKAAAKGALKAKALQEQEATSKPSNDPLTSSPNSRPDETSPKPR